MTVYVADLSQTGEWSEALNASAGSFAYSSPSLVITKTAASDYRIAWAGASGALDADGNRDNFEILVKGRHTNPVGSGTTTWGVFGRGTSGPYFRITPYQSKAYITADGDTGVAFTPTEDVWYWVRFRCNGTACYARIWAHGAAEPTSWQITETDASYSAGEIGILGLSTDADPFEVAYFAVATNGDSVGSSSASSAALLGVDF